MRTSAQVRSAAAQRRGSFCPWPWALLIGALALPACDDTPSDPPVQGDDSELLGEIASAVGVPSDALPVPGEVLGPDGATLKAIAVVTSNDLTFHGMQTLAASVGVLGFSGSGEESGTMVFVGLSVFGSNDLPADGTEADIHGSRVFGLTGGPPAWLVGGLEPVGFAQYGTWTRSGDTMSLVSWLGTSGRFRMESASFEGDPQPCPNPDLPPDVTDFGCTVDSGHVTGSYEFTAEPVGGGEPIVTQPFVNFDLPAIFVSLRMVAS